MPAKLKECKGCGAKLDRQRRFCEACKFRNAEAWRASGGGHNPRRRKSQLAKDGGK